MPGFVGFSTVALSLPVFAASDFVVSDFTVSDLFASAGSFSASLFGLSVVLGAVASRGGLSFGCKTSFAVAVFVSALRFFLLNRFLLQRKKSPALPQGLEIFEKFPLSKILILW